MYKTAVICDEVSQDLRTACELACRYKLDGMEIRTVNEKNPFQMNREDYKYVRSVCDDAGLKICAVGAPLFKCNLDSAEEYESHLEGLRRSAEAAHVWGTDIVRGFTFWHVDNPASRFGEIAEKYQKAIRIAEENDIRIVIESEPSVNTMNMGMLYDFLRLLSSDRVAALFDAGNEATDVNCPAPYPCGYELLKPYIKHVHLKDTRASKNGTEFFEPAMIGEGDVDYQGLISRLKADDYDGWVSVETHWRLKHARFTDEELARPGGSSFSEGGYESTEAYLKALRDIFKWQEA